MTTDEEVLTPGPDGRLISTDERMQQVRQAQSESPAPASTDGKCLSVSAAYVDAIFFIVTKVLKWSVIQAIYIIQF